jgi:hypothetical protein
MPHLHLPAEHSDADIVLAASVAATVGSEDLYVAWTHDTGAGAVPEVEAVLRDDRPSALTTFVRALADGVLALWHGLTASPAATAPAVAAPAAPARETSS